MAEDVVLDYVAPPLGGVRFVPEQDVGRARVRTDPIVRPSEIEATS